MMNLTIKKWGNSQGVRIPKSLLSKIGIDDPVNQSISVDVQDNKLVIEKVSGKSKFAQRFEGFDLDKYYNENSGSQEMGWGQDVGNEIID